MVLSFINLVNLTCLLAIGYNSRNWRLICYGRFICTSICIVSFIVILFPILTSSNASIVIAFFILYGISLFFNLVFMSFGCQSIKAYVEEEPMRNNVYEWNTNNMYKNLKVTLLVALIADLVYLVLYVIFFFNLFTYVFRVN